MNDYKGLLIFVHVVLTRASGYKKLPLFLRDEIEMLSDRWECNTLAELRAKVKEELNHA